LSGQIPKKLIDVAPTAQSLLASFGAARTPALHDAVLRVRAVSVFFAAVRGVGAGELLGTVRSHFGRVVADAAAISEDDARAARGFRAIRVRAAAGRHARLRRSEASRQTRLAGTTVGVRSTAIAQTPVERVEAAQPAHGPRGYEDGEASAARALRRRATLVSIVRRVAARDRSMLNDAF